MKKIVIVFMCVVLLCMTFTVSAFAEETETETTATETASFELPDNAVVVEPNTTLQSGRTYYVSWIVKSSKITEGYKNVGYINKSSTTVVYIRSISENNFHPNEWYNYCGSTTFINTYVYPMVSAHYHASDLGITNPNASSPVDVAQTDVFYTATLETEFTDLYFGVNPEYSDMIYFYFLCDHVYDNSCDADCNECGTEREVIHAYPDDNDHNCSVCAYANPEPTHIYDNDDDLICNYCNYERPKPDPMEKLLSNVALSSAGIFGLAGLFTAWAIADELVALGLVFSVISFIAYLIIKSKREL